MQALDQSGSISESAFRLSRLFLQILIFLLAVAASRWGTRTILLRRGTRSNRWRNSFFAINLTVLVLLLFLRVPAEKLLTTVGGAIARLRPASELGCVGGMLAGLLYVAIATSILLLAIHVVGLVYWFAD